MVEQVFADVTSGPLAHMPSGVFAAKRRVAIDRGHDAQPAARRRVAVASLPSARARAATIRRDLITVAARTATNRRRPIAVDGHSDASHESSASP